MKKTISINSRVVGEDQPCYIIAEAGVNHNGSVELAKKLIKKAAEAGTDAVKFQKRSIKDILISEALAKSYIGPNSLGSTYGEHREKLELSEADYKELVRYAKEVGITFLASVWDKPSADFIESLGAPAFKIPSADLTNLPLLEHVARKGKPVILSTGMSTLEEVREAVNEVLTYNDQLILLHCISVYPCEPADVNLRIMETLRKEFGVLVGYSGHEKTGYAVTEAAVALGAVVVERHFTLDRTMPGPDHSASLDSFGLARLVAHIREDIEPALGSPEKKISEAEWGVRARLAKSIVSACDIKAGTVIQPEMLTVKGPGTGLKPKYLSRLYGKVAQGDIQADTLVPLEALSW
jgi:sialic acid synthase SpsE